MNKKTIYVILVFFLLTVTFGFSNWINKDQFSFKENDVTTEEKLFKTEHKTQSTFACASPSDQGVKNLKSDEATIYWDDDSGTAWEYIIQLPTAPYPTGSGTPTTVKEVTITQDSNGNNLQPDTTYEFYVRTDCGTDGQSSWLGPFEFKTLCASFTIPFVETFNTTSVSLDCWTFIDANNDANPSNVWRSNIWKKEDQNPYEGNGAVFFGGDRNKTHDDWLISPALELSDTEIYEVTYYIVVSGENNEYGVLLSVDGMDLDNFTHVLKPYENTKGYHLYEKRKFYIENISGKAHLGWHAISSGITGIYIDLVSVEKVSCKGVDQTNIEIAESKRDEVTIEWKDDNNSNWEYYVQPSNSGLPTPLGGGFLTGSKKAVINRTTGSGGLALQPNTEYEFYIRSQCNLGANSNSTWEGPVLFKTSCDVFSLPFWEGFNSTSDTFDCWRIIDANNDGAMWSNKHNYYEGDRGVTFQPLTSTYPTSNDDWLFSPTFELDQNKIYKISYKYQFRSYITDDGKYSPALELLATTGGQTISNKTKILSPNKTLEDIDINYGLSGWEKEELYFTDISGEVNLVWRINGNILKIPNFDEYGGGYFYIDDVLIEEVACPSPLIVEIEQEENKEEIKLSWQNEFGNDSWEYYIRKSSQDSLPPSGSGIYTNQTENTVDKDFFGDLLESNTEYEVYVRSYCTTGEHGEWSGPFIFTTACGVFQVPFWEGFNSYSKTIDCWKFYNEDSKLYEGENWVYNSGSVYEGDRSISIFTMSFGWAISPRIYLDGGNYILKYNYISPSNILDILPLSTDYKLFLSTKGTEFDDFDIELLSQENLQVRPWKEQTVFISGVKGDVNLAWMVKTTGIYAFMAIDNVSLTKVENCPEPYDIKETDYSEDSVTIEWKQEGNITAWEVYVSDSDSLPPASPATLIKVSRNPEVTLPNLDPGKKYIIYVRAICSEANDTSAWSTPLKTTTKIQNDNCSSAINIPVNKGYECIENQFVSFKGATASAAADPDCYFDDYPKKDVWFEFVATSSWHRIAINEEEIYPKRDEFRDAEFDNYPQIYGAIYEGDCSSNISDTSSPACFMFSEKMGYGYRPNLGYNYQDALTVIVSELEPGKKYYLRLQIDERRPEYFFNICITSPYIETEGISDEYDEEQLVKDYLFGTTCNIISNVNYTQGDGSNPSINSLGSFNKAGSYFPFEEGLVLSTFSIDELPGPGTSFNGFPVDQVDRFPLMNLTSDIQLFLEDIYFPSTFLHKIASLEFDFVALQDTLQLEYLFGYKGSQNCTPYSNAYSAVLLTDLTTGTTENILLTPETKDLISDFYIKKFVDEERECQNRNPTLLWKDFNEIDRYSGKISREELWNNPTSLNILFQAMTTEKLVLNPGKKYRIQILTGTHEAPIRPGPRPNALFLNKLSQSFIPTVELEILKDDNYCKVKERKIVANFNVDQTIKKKIEWYKDGVLLEGETAMELSASENGTYEVVISLADFGCEFSGSIELEIRPLISEVVQQPQAIQVCHSSLQDIVVNLKQAEKSMFNKNQAEREDYITSYYKTKQDAEQVENPIKSPFEYNLGNNIEDTIFYIRVEDTQTDCYEVFELYIQPEQGAIPDKPSDVAVCAEYIFPATANNQYYYTESGGAGKAYKTGDVLTEPGEHTIYLLQINSEEGCYEETSYKVNVTAPVVADVFEDEILSCEYYELKPLSEYNSYYTEPEGQGNKLYPGMQILEKEIVYVYASSEDYLCTDESSFTIDYEDCPIPRGISPNNDGLNDVFDLTPHGVESIKIYNRWGTEVYSHGAGYTTQWHGQSKNGKQLPDGTYYYVIIAHGKTRTGWVQINK